MGNISNRQKLHRIKRDELGLNLWQRLTRILLLASVVGLGIFVFSVFAPEWDKLKEMDQENAMLKEHLDELLNAVNKINSLQFNIGRLETQKHKLLHEVALGNDTVSLLQDKMMKEYGSYDINLTDGTINWPKNEK